MRSAITRSLAAFSGYSLNTIGASHGGLEAGAPPGRLSSRTSRSREAAAELGLRQPRTKRRTHRHGAGLVIVSNLNGEAFLPCCSRRLAQRGVTAETMIGGLPQQAVSAPSSRSIPR